MGDSLSLAALAGRAPRLREVLIVPPLMCALFAVAFFPLLGGGKSFADFQDNTYYHEPVFGHIARSFARGEYPYRAGELMGGITLYDTSPFSLIYPFYFFRSGLYASPPEAIRQLHYLTLLHLLIAYFNCYVLLRVVRLGPLPALLGASLFALGASLFGLCAWVRVIAPYSWLPLALAGAVLVIEDRRPSLGLLLTTAALTLLVWASPAHALIHAAYLVGVLYLFRAAGWWRRKARAEFLRVTKNLAAAAALTFALGAPVLVPVLLRTHDAIRFCGDEPPAVGFARPTYRATLLGQLEVKHLAGTLLPYEVPSAIGRPFFGMGAALLALLALFRARKSWIVAPLFFAGLYALASSTGSHLGLARVNYLLPLLGEMREPDIHLVVFTLCFAALAGFGFDYLVETLGGGYRRLSDWKHLALLLLFLAALAASWAADLQYVGARSGLFLLGACALAFGLLALLPRVGARAGNVVVVLAASLVVYGHLQFPYWVTNVRDNEYYGPANLSSHRALSELAQLPGARDYRVLYAADGLDDQKWSMNASFYGLRSFQAYFDPMPYRQFGQIYHTRFYPRPYTLLLGARFYVCDACDDARSRGYRFDRRVGDYNLYVNDGALPRYALVSRLAGLYDGDADFYAKAARGFDFANEVYVDGAGAARLQGWLGAQTAPAARAIKEEYSSQNLIRLRVETAARAVVLLNEYDDGAWRARVNGRAVETVRLNLNQVGVPVDGGSSVVEFEYEPLVYVWLLRAQRVVLAAYVLYVIARARLAIRGRSQEATG